MHYEIHLTVEESDIEKFKATCTELNVKPIIIETQRGISFNNQVMTSSKHTSVDYKATLMLLTAALRNRGHKVIREKVEIMPMDVQHSNHIYYETHFRLKFPKGFDTTRLRLFCRMADFHLSKNLFKATELFDYQMITYRNNSGNLTRFRAMIQAMKIWLTEKEIEFDKVEVEECIYDSNIAVDKNWIPNLYKFN